MITSPQNNKVKALRFLLKGKGQSKAAERALELLRPDQGSEAGHGGELLLLEGPNLLEAALDRGMPLVVVAMTDSFMEKDHPIIRRLPIAPLVIDASLLANLADADSPQGLIAVVESPPTPTATPTGVSGLAVYLDRIRDPKNLGAVLRVAEAAGADLVALSPECVSWRHPRALRSSAGSALRVRLAQEMSPAHLKAADEGPALRWIGLDAEGSNLFDESNSLTDGPSGPVVAPVIVAVGSESQGLSASTRNHCQTLVRIPMLGQIESLNLATAAALALYHLRFTLGSEMAFPASNESADLK